MSTTWLTEDEKREVLECIQQGKPLDEKYRFKLFGDKKQVELVWNGKRDIHTMNTVLPFQYIEHIDEPRTDVGKSEVGLFDTSGRQAAGWTNKLIWGDNKLVLSSLVQGPMRDEIEKNGGIKLIYIDPPFDVGANFTTKVKVGDEEVVKEASGLEELAYRDTWGRGADSFIAMLYERLVLMRDLLADDGSIYVHCDWRVNSYIRLILDEVFGKENFRNQVAWCYRGGGNEKNNYKNKHDTILFYTKGTRNIFNWKDISIAYKEIPITASWRNNTREEAMKIAKKKMEEGMVPYDWWDDIPAFSTATRSKERLDYPTQKPEKLLERIIKASSNENDIV